MTDDIHDLTDMIAQVTRIWTEMLEVPDLAADSNFFEFGGNARELVDMVFLVEEEFAVALSEDDIRELTTIRSVCETVMRLRDEAD